MRLHFRTFQHVSGPAQDLAVLAWVWFDWIADFRRLPRRLPGGREGENLIFKRTRHSIEFLALLVAVCGAATVHAAAADGRAPGTTGAVAQALPAAGTYKIDPDHSFAFFSAWHHIVGRVRGRFDKVDGTITVSKNVADCGADVTIATESISTQNSERDDDLRGPDYFDAKKFPSMTYHGRGIRRGSANSWVLEGSLTIRGVTRAVPLMFTFNGAFGDTPPGKPVRVAFHGTAAAKRGDFGMTRDNLSELGLSPKGPDVEIEIDVEADAVSPKQ